MKGAWRIGRNDLRVLRGMIIDRDAAWRADAEMAPFIEAVIRRGIEDIDEKTCNVLYMYLRYGPLDEAGCRHPLSGSYETCGFDEKQMAGAWRKYLKRHRVHPKIT